MLWVLIRRRGEAPKRMFLWKSKMDFPSSAIKYSSLSLSARQTKANTFTNSIDLNETARDEPFH